MSWGRMIYYAICTLVVAGIVHISVVLLIPAYGTKDAFATISGKIDPLDFKPVSELGGNVLITDVDPYFAYGLCRFDLKTLGMQMSAPKIDTFWSATLIDEDGTVIYSLNSRTAIDNKLDLILLNPVQILRLREVAPIEAESAIIVESDVNAGFVVVRVLRPDENWAAKANGFLNKVECKTYVPTSVVVPEADEEPGQPSG
ncbi:MAG: hypothetical protein WBO55_11815 [Rhizobiaceae bacterium]